MKRMRSKITKRILGLILIMGCSGVFFNGYVGVAEPTHAAGGTIDASTDGSTQSISTMGLWEILNLILKIIYLLLWPLLVVAGIALDNTLVYASVFHLDAPLWKFWNMIKNFANFALGFMVLFAIIKSILTNGGQGSLKDEKSPLGIIKKTLIAGVLIQASRFLMAALVDLSTVATYAVGGLPLSVLKNTEIGNQKILTVNSEIDLNKFNALSKKGEGFKIWYSTKYNGKLVKISPCRVEKSFVVGREMGDSDYRNTEIFASDAKYKEYEVCVLFGNQLVMRKEDDFMTKITQKLTLPTPLPDRKTEQGYDTMMTTLLNVTGWQNTGRVTGSLVNIKGGINQEGFALGSGFFAASTSTTISDLIKKSKGFVGPLVTIYSSILNFSQLTDTSVTSMSETSGIFLIKTGIAIALFFPLIALAIVLIARIGLLRLYIAGSPFLIIKKVFGESIPKLGDSFDKHLELGNVVKLIFAPVITVAALSISLIFMTALINGFKSGDNQQISSDVAENLQIQPIDAKEGNQAFRVGGSTELEFKNFDRGGTLDRFSWLVVNFFAIGLLWTILFAAIKANALGEKIGGKVQDFGSSFFQTLPIIPFPGGGGERVGLGSAISVLADRPTEYIREREAADKSKVEALFEEPEVPTILSATQAKTIIPSASTSSESITAAVQKLGVTDVNTVLSASTATLYETINNLTKVEKERDALIAEVAEAGGLGPDWYTKETTRLAKEKVATMLTDGSITKDSKVTDIQKVIDTTANKATLKSYFDSDTSATAYTQVIGDNTLTINKSGDIYTAVLTTTPTTTAPAPATTTPTAEETALTNLLTTGNDAKSIQAIIDKTTDKKVIETYFASLSANTTTPTIKEYTGKTTSGASYTITQTSDGKTPATFTYTTK